MRREKEKEWISAIGVENLGDTHTVKYQNRKMTKNKHEWLKESSMIYHEFDAPWPSIHARHC